MDFDLASIWYRVGHAQKSGGDAGLVGETNWETNAF